MQTELAELVHDRICQPLVLASLAVQQAQIQVQSSDADEAWELLDTVRKQLDGASVELHKAIDAVLRIDEDDPPARIDLTKPSLKSIHAWATLIGSDVRVTSDPAVGQLDFTVRIITYGVATEGVTNAIKHGGPGPISVSLTLDTIRDRVEVSVSSVDPDRCGDAPVIREGERGLGLALRRVRTLGGTLEARRDNGLFILTASVPAHPAEPEEARP